MLEANAQYTVKCTLSLFATLKLVNANFSVIKINVDILKLTLILVH